MNLTLRDEQNTSFLEGAPGEPLLASAGEANRLIEACFGEGAHAMLLHAANLPPAFFDLSTSQAGEILQKLRNYRIRLALVAPPGTALSTRFSELLADERGGAEFGMFESRAEAVEWLSLRG